MEFLGGFSNFETWNRSIREFVDIYSQKSKKMYTLVIELSGQWTRNAGAK